MQQSHSKLLYAENFHKNHVTSFKVNWSANNMTFWLIYGTSNFVFVAGGTRGWSMYDVYEFGWIRTRISLHEYQIHTRFDSFKI